VKTINRLFISVASVVALSAALIASSQNQPKHDDKQTGIENAEAHGKKNANARRHLAANEQKHDAHDAAKHHGAAAAHHGTMAAHHGPATHTAHNGEVKHRGNDRDAKPALKRAKDSEKSEAKRREDKDDRGEHKAKGIHKLNPFHRHKKDKKVKD
jgi:hypothetical protein